MNCTKIKNSKWEFIYEKLHRRNIPAILCIVSPQGDISPRAAPKSRETQSETTSTSAPAKKQKAAVVTVKPTQGSKSKGRKVNNAPKAVVEEAEKEVLEGNEGIPCFYNTITHQ